MRTRFLCWLGLHTPNRHKRVWDGATYRAPCRGCKRELVRIARKRWRQAPSTAAR